MVVFSVKESLCEVCKYAYNIRETGKRMCLALKEERKEPKEVCDKFEMEESDEFETEET
jgi:hypothetical protein